MVDIRSQINNLENDKLLVIVASNSEDRKVMHQYLEKEFPTVGRTSLGLRCFDRIFNAIVMECWNCDSKNAVVRYSPNAEDYMRGDCSRCGERNVFEPSIDYWSDEFRYIYDHNSVVLGNYIKRSFNRPFHAEDGYIPAEQFDEVVDGKKIFIVDAPSKLIKKAKLQNHIVDQYLKLDIES